jgi:DNA mismatch repair protein MutL
VPQVVGYAQRENEPASAFRKTLAEPRAPYASDREHNATAPDNQSPPGISEVIPAAAALTLLGHIGHTYLVLRDDTTDTLVLLDQHAVHERVLLARMEQSASAGKGQTLLLPLVLPLHPAEHERLEQTRATLRALGFELGADKQELEVYSIPLWLSRGEAAGLLRDVLGGNRDNPEDLNVSAACKAAVKAGHSLSQDETVALIAQWLALPEETREFCPHGRPCVLRFTTKELEKLFKRG